MLQIYWFKPEKLRAAEGRGVSQLVLVYARKSKQELRKAEEEREERKQECVEEKKWRCCEHYNS